MEPVVEVPPAEPGQTVDIDLEVKQITEENIEGSALEVAYCLVTPCGQPFGEVLAVQVAPAKTTVLPPPVCVVLRGPVQDSECGPEALQGELKIAQWTLANVGAVAWPDDAHCELFYNTPGFAHLPGSVDVPKGVGPGMTVDVTIPIKLPEQEGRFQAMWAVASPSTPAFGEVLVVEFNVGEFPFMEWMVAEEAVADSVSENESEVTVPSNPVFQFVPPSRTEIQTQANSKLSAAHLMHNHVAGGDCNITYNDAPHEMANEEFDVVSVGHITGLAAGTTWILEVALTNDGDVQWPEDTMLSCCAGDGFGCKQLPLDCLNPGESGLIQMELKMSESPARCAWTLTTGGDGCFGPVFVLDAV
jgi:hypothetical protein